MQCINVASLECCAKLSEQHSCKVMLPDTEAHHGTWHWSETWAQASAGKEALGLELIRQMTMLHNTRCVDICASVFVRFVCANVCRVWRCLCWLWLCLCWLWCCRNVCSLIPVTEWSSGRMLFCCTEDLGFKPRVGSPRSFTIDFHQLKLCSLSIACNVKSNAKDWAMDGWESLKGHSRENQCVL